MKSIYLFLVLSMLGTAAGENSVALNVVPGHYEAGANETFIISIDVNPNNNKVYSAQFDLLFNNSLLEGIRVEKGDFLRQNAMQTISPVNLINNSIGKIEYSEKRTGTETGAANPGSIAVITFRVKADAKMGSNQSFTLKNVTITDSSLKKLPVESKGGEFKVAGSRVQAQLPAPQGTPDKNRIISQELADAMNQSGDTGKISIKISIDDKDSVQNLLNLAAFLKSRGTDVSDINQLSDSITCRASRRLITEISSMPFVTQITIYKGAAQDGTEKLPGFGIMITAVIVLIMYLGFRKNKNLIKGEML